LFSGTCSYDRPSRMQAVLDSQHVTTWQLSPLPSPAC
jgi:hypothetical protein